jgi:hypothetical protein
LEIPKGLPCYNLAVLFIHECKTINGGVVVGRLLYLGRTFEKIQNSAFLLRDKIIVLQTSGENLKRSSEKFQYHSSYNHKLCNNFVINPKDSI